MTDKATCPNCAGKLIWNGTAMTCISCAYIAPVEPVKTRSEKKIPSAKKGK